MSEDEKKEERMRWYNRTEVKYEIVKINKNREVSFLGELNIRGLFLRTVSFYNLILHKLRFDRKDCNMYHSLDVFKRLPLFSMDFQKRGLQIEKFIKEFGSYYVASDFGIDFDNRCKYYVKPQKKEDGNFDPAYCNLFKKSVTKLRDCEECEHKRSGFQTLCEDAEFVKKMYDEYKVPYYIVCTENGLAFRVPAEYVPIDYEIFDREDKMEFRSQKKKRYSHLISIDEPPSEDYFKLKNAMVQIVIDFYGSIASELVTTFDLRSIDEAIYTRWRLFKSPFSIGKRNLNVVLPLTDKLFENIVDGAKTGKYNSMDDVSFLKSWNISPVQIRDRGLMIREGTKENFLKFINEIIYGN